MYAAHLDLSKPLFWTVDAVLSPAECAALVARIESLGPKIAPVSRADGPVVDLGTRNNTRVMFDDPELAARLFARIARHVPAELMGRRVTSANERLRCYKYEPGQRFAPHYDGAFFRDDQERSLLTFMVYLNEGFTGGDTRFLELEQSVRPKTGRALLFQHAILHEGCAVEAGIKYVVRSDVMYRRP